MATASSISTRLQFGKVLRERFLAEMSQAMVELGTSVQARLTELVDETGNVRTMQTRREVWENLRRRGRCGSNPPQKSGASVSSH